MPVSRPSSAHHDRKDERRDGQQYGEDHGAAHHVAEQADGQRQRARQFADDVERQHDDGRLQVGLEIGAQAALRDAEQRHRDEHAQRERSRGRERSGRRLVAGEDRAQVGQRDEQEQRAQESQIFFRMAQADFFDLFADIGHHDFEQALPARDMHLAGEIARDEFGAHGQHQHQHPGRHDGGVELEESVLPQDQFVGTKVHGSPPVPSAGAVSLMTMKRAMMKPSRHTSSRFQSAPATK